MEADHVRFVRRQFPDAAAKTAMIRRLCRDLAPAPPGLGRAGGRPRPGRGGGVDGDDVLDPAGHEATSTRACVDELWGLCRALVTRALTVAASAAAGAFSRRAPSAARPRPGRPCAGPAAAPPPPASASVSGRCAMKRRLAPSAMPDDPVGQQASVVVVEPGVDQRVDRLGDGVLHGAQRPAQLLVVGVVPPVEQPELGLVADDQPEVGGEAQLDLLARAVGLAHRACRWRSAGPGRWSRPAPGRAPASRRSAGRGAAWSPRPPRRCRPSSSPGSPAARRARAPPRTAAGAAVPRSAAARWPGSLLPWSFTLPNGHARRAAEEPGTLSSTRRQRRREVGQVEVRAATAWLCVSNSLVRASEPGRRAEPGRCASNQRKPKAASSARHRVGPDGQRAPVGGRLDRGVAEALPRRGQQDGVAGGVRVGDRSSRPAGSPEDDRAAGPRRRRRSSSGP